MYAKNILVIIYALLKFVSAITLAAEKFSLNKFGLQQF